MSGGGLGERGRWGGGGGEMGKSVRTVTLACLWMPSCFFGVAGGTREVLMEVRARFRPGGLAPETGCVWSGIANTRFKSIIHSRSG